MAYDLTKDHLVGAEAYSNNDMAITAGTRKSGACGHGA